jgi:hypothetical protein
MGLHMTVPKHWWDHPLLYKRYLIDRQKLKEQYRLEFEEMSDEEKGVDSSDHCSGDGGMGDFLDTFLGRH